ncbi:MAG: tandem-95 repeat protein, partial [Magnetococcales bacterium]|nr:tandem-95 repeat protein [Magnetococcales bacterium]
MIRTLPLSTSFFHSIGSVAKSTAPLLLHAGAGDETILLPDASFLLQGEYARDGYDLLITNPDGAMIRITGYFALSHPPLLVLANGSGLTFETVKALALADHGPVLAAGDAAPTGGELGKLIGKADSLTGTVEAKGKDGVTRTLKEGDPIHEGDQVTTGEKSLAKFVMQDGTVFQVGESARALVDQFVFQPEAGKGQFAATVLTGTFRYASGQLSQLNPGKHTVIKTPTAEIGVRGSELLGEVVTDGSTTVVHNAGILEIADLLGRGVVTLLKPGTATAVRLGGGAPLPVFLAPDSLLQHLNGQVSDQAIFRAREAERRQQENPRPVEPDQRGDQPGSSLTPGDGEQTGTVVVDPDGKPVVISWDALHSLVKNGASFTILEESLGGRSQIDPALLKLSGTGASFVINNLLFTLGTYDLTVTRVNHPPFLPAVTSQMVDQDGRFVLQLAGWSDPDGDAVTLSARLADGAALPTWLSFNPDTGLFSGTPGSGDVGQWAITLNARDIQSAVTNQVFTLTVNNVNDAPVVSQAVTAGTGLLDRTVVLKNVGGTYQAQTVEGGSYAFQLPSATFADADLGVDPGEALVYSAVLVDRAGNQQPLPSWLQFDAATRVVTVVGALPADVGSYGIRVTATDQAGMSATDTFLLAMRTADTPYVQVEQGFFVDAPAGGLIYQSGNMTGMTDSRGGFYYRPGETITFKLGGLTLGEVQTSELSPTTVVLTPLSLAATSGGGTNQNVLTNLLRLLQTVDNDGNPENGIIISSNTVALAGSLQLDLSVPTEVFAANSVLRTFLTRAGFGDLVSAEAALAHFQRTLDAGISVPLTLLPQFHAVQNQLYATSLPQGFFVDPNGDPLTVQATLADGSPLPDWLSFTPNTLTFAGTPDPLDIGTRIIRVTATNSVGQSAAKNFELVVANVNDAPLFATVPGMLSAVTGTVFEYRIPAGMITDADVTMQTGDQLTLRATLADGGSLPSWLTFDAADGRFSGTPPAEEANRDLTLRVTVQDRAGLTAATDFVLRVVPPNRQPLAQEIANQAAQEDALFRFVLPEGTFTDPDAGDTLTLTAARLGGGALPEWLQFDGATRSFSGTPGQGDVGVLDLRVTATDRAGLSVSGAFQLQVANVNDAPEVMGSIADREVLTGGTLGFDLAAGLFQDLDPGDLLTYAATLKNGTPLPEWVLFDPQGRHFDITPPFGSQGGYEVRVTARDQAGASVSADFTLTVNTVNHPPVVNPDLVPDWTVREQEGFAAVVPAGLIVDVDVGQTLIWHADLPDGSPLPEWLRFDPATRQFSGLLTDVTGNQITVRVTATDTGGESASVSFGIDLHNVNDAPLLVEPLVNRFASQGILLRVTLSEAFVDVDPGDRLTPSIALSDGAPLPEWLQFDAASWTLSGTPGEADVGQLLNVRLTVTDLGGATNSDLFLMLVTLPNEPPTVAQPLADQNARQGDPFLFQIPEGAFVDPDGNAGLEITPTLVGGLPLPAWLGFDPATRLFFGTPQNGDVGTLQIAVDVKDPAGAWVTDTFALQVANVNDVPVVNQPIDDAYAVTDQPFEWQLGTDVFTDVDPGAQLTWSAQLSGGAPLPGWLHFDPATRTFTGTPTVAHLGSQGIRVTVNDGAGGVASDLFVLSVTRPNHLPVVVAPLSDQTVHEDQSFYFMLNTEAFRDADESDTLTYTARLANGEPLPSWLTFDPLTRLFSGVAGNEQVGDLAIVVTASDGRGGVVTNPFTLHVVNVNDAPVLTQPVPDQTTEVGAGFVYTLPADLFTDMDAGDSLTLAATRADGTALPSWLLFDADTRTFTTTATPEIGPLAIRVSATDSGAAQAADLFVLNVLPRNNPPTVAHPLTTQRIAQDQLFFLTIPDNTFQDVDANDRLSLSALLSDGASLPDWLVFDPTTGTFFGRPGNDQVGTYPIRVSAQDGRNAVVSSDFDLVVTNVNDAPVAAIAIPDQYIDYGTRYHYALLPGTFTDPDGDGLQYALTKVGGGSVPEWLQIDPVTGVLSSTRVLEASDATRVLLRLTATDPAGAVGASLLTLTVTHPNHAPTAKAAPSRVTVLENQEFLAVLPADQFVDADAGDLLTWSATLADGASLPEWLHFDPVTRSLSGRPDFGAVGEWSVRVTARDQRGVSAEVDWTVQVNNVNDAPMVTTPLEDLRIFVDASMAVTTAGVGHFSDLDAGDTLSYQLFRSGGGTLPAWLSIDPVTGALRGTPTAPGIYDLRMTATDSGLLSASYGFRLTVAAANRAPEVRLSMTDQQATEESAFSFHLPDGLFLDPDSDAPLSLEATRLDGTPLPAWLTFDARTGMFTGLPGNGDTGSLGVRVTASDSDGARVATHFTIQVANVNDAPELMQPVADQHAFQDRSFRFALPEATFADVDGDLLTWSVEDLATGGDLPAWLRFDAVTHGLIGTPGVHDLGVVNVKVTVTDPAGSLAADTFRLTVHAPNVAPTVANPLADQVAIEDQAFLLRIPESVFADASVDDVLTLALSMGDGSALPGWLHFDPETRVVSGTPDNGDVARLELRLTATDRAGDAVSDLFVLNVTNVNDAPTLVTTLHDQQAAVGRAFLFSIPTTTFADVDVGDRLTLSAANLTPNTPLPSWLHFDPATGLFSGVPTAANLGSTYVKVTATDGSNRTVSDVFTLQVVEHLTGTLLDSEVEGVHFVTASRSGETGASGGFQFLPGEQVTFSIGDIVLGQTLGGTTVTPLDLVGHGDWNATTNLLRFLQTLDANGNPEDGITISQTARAAAQGVQIHFDRDLSVFAADSALQTFLTAATGQNTLVGVDQAWSHFQNTLIRVAATSGAGILSTSPANPTAIEDVAFRHRLADDPVFAGLDRPQWSLVNLAGANLPTWLEWDAQSGLLSGTPANNAVGVTPLQVSARGADGTTITKVITLTVANINDAPTTAELPDDLFATLGDLFQFRVPATMFADVDAGERLVYGVEPLQGSALPSWLTFDATTGTLTGTPVTVNTAGIDLRITATDRAGAATSGVVHLTVVDANQPPQTIGTVSDVHATEDRPLFHSMAGLFADPEGGDLKFSLTALNATDPVPAWLRFDPETQLLTGHPDNAGVGSHALRLTATDSAGKSSSVPFTLHVANVNDAPVLSGALTAQIVTPGTAWRYQLPLDTFIDVDAGDLLTLTATLANGSALPTWLTFEPATATFIGTPGAADLGSLAVRVMATDRAQSMVTGGFQLTVQAVGNAPELQPDQFPGDLTVLEDQSFALTLPEKAFMDADAGATLTYSAGGVNGSLPAWLHFDPETRILSGTPRNADVNVTGVRITARDETGLETTGSFNITVTNVNDAPVVATRWQPQFLAIGREFAIQVPETLFADVDVGDRLSYGATLADGTALPAWLKFDPATRSFLGTPVGTPGTLAIKLTATDLANRAVSQEVTFRVTGSNQAPQLTSLSDQNAAEDQFFQYQIPVSAFSDPDAGDTLTFAASGLPSWMTFDPATRTLSGTPTNSAIGATTIRLTVTDAGGLEAAQSILVAVMNTPDAPELVTPLVDRTVQTGQPFRFGVDAASFRDVDPGEVLSYSATRLDGTALPTWLTFDPALRMFSGTPTASQGGEYAIKITATDSTGLLASDAFNLVVATPNTLPVLTQPLSARSVHQDQPFVYQLPADLFTDADLAVGDTLSYAATTLSGGMLPDWLRFDPQTRTFSGTPRNADVGAFSVRVTATDHQSGAASGSFILDVINVNDAPVAAIPLNDQRAFPGGTFRYVVPRNAFVDVDAGDRLTFGASLADGSALPGWLRFDASSRTLIGTPDTSDLGSMAIKVTAADQSGSSASMLFNLEVRSINRAPVGTGGLLPAQIEVLEDQALNFRLPASLFTDADGDVLSLSVVSLEGNTLPEWLSFDPATRSLSGRPLNAHVGSTPIKITATDPYGKSASLAVALNVLNTNDAPQLQQPVANQQVNVGEIFRFQVPSASFVDADAGDRLTLTAAGLPSWLTFDPATATFSGRPDGQARGSSSIQLTATDLSGAAVSTTFQLTVGEVNRAPVLTGALSDQQLVEDRPFLFTVPGNLFTDSDPGTTLTYSARGLHGELPTWLRFDPVSRTFSGTPGNNDTGAFTVRLTAADGAGGSASGTFRIQVANVNDAPVVMQSIPAQGVLVGQTWRLTLSEGLFQDPDVGDRLSYRVTLADANGSALPAWLRVDAATLSLTGTPTAADVGTLNLRVTATDPSRSSVSQIFTLRVAETNHAPTVATVLANQTVDENQLFQISVRSGFADADPGDLLSLTWTTLGVRPDWLFFDAQSGQFYGTPDHAAANSVTAIRVTATDVFGAQVAQLFQIAVRNVNDAPQLVSPLSDQLVISGQPWTFQFAAESFRDIDAGDRLSYQATLANGADLPGWLRFDGVTRTFTATPEHSHAGVHAVRVTASDGTATVSDTFDLTVRVLNTAPSLTAPLSDQTATQGQRFHVTLPADLFQDADSGDALTLTATTMSGQPLPTWLRFDPVSRTFTGTPANADVGNLRVKVVATDGQQATAAGSFAITVANVNDAPVVSAPLGQQYAYQGQPFRFQVPNNLFTDSDVGDVLTLSATLPNGAGWLRFDPASRSFSGVVPTLSNALGSFAVGLRATDGSGASVATTFTLNVTQSNTAPVLLNPLPTVVNAREDQSFRYQIPANTFFDADASDTLQWSITSLDGSPLPSWLTVNPTTGVLSGTPRNAHVGSWNIKVTASDGRGGSAADFFSLAVENTNDAPRLNAPMNAVTVQEGNALNLVLAPDTFTDVDVGDRLSYSATLANGQPLPSWLTFHAETLSFSGTPGHAQVGTVAVRVVARDGAGTEANGTFDLTVTVFNRAPTVETPLAAQTVHEDQPFRFRIPNNSFADADGDRLTYRVTPLSGDEALPGWLTFNAANATLSGTPGDAAVGEVYLRVTARDPHGAAVSSVLRVTVNNVNDAPEVLTPLPNVSVVTGEAFARNLGEAFRDADVGDRLQFVATRSDGLAWPAWLILDGTTGRLIGTPGTDDVGTIPIQVTVRDQIGAEVSSAFALDVIESNHAPEVAHPVADQTIQQNQTFRFALPANMFVDVDAGDQLVVSASLSGGEALPSWLSFDPATGVFSGRPGQSQVGVITVRLTAVDHSGERVADFFDLRVVDVNDPPTGGVTVTGNATQGQRLTASNTLADLDGLGTIAYQWRADGVAITGATGATFLLTESEVGKRMTVAARYTDRNGTSEQVISTSTQMVSNVNDPATGSVMISGTPTQGQPLTANSNTLADLDGMGVLSYQWRADGVAITGATGSNLLLTQSHVGKVITVTARYTDGHGTVERITSSPTVEVANRNDAPGGRVTISGTPVLGEELFASHNLTDRDGLGSVSWQWYADGVEIADATGATFVLTSEQVGKAITVTASYTDGYGWLESVTSPATQEVGHINHAPTGSIVITGSTTQDETLTVDLSGLADADGLGAISCQWFADGEELEGATEPTLQLGQLHVGKSITVTASYTDLGGTQESVTSDLVGPVVNVNDAPTGSVTIGGVVRQGEELFVTTALTDLDGIPGGVQYRWYMYGRLIHDATQATLTLVESMVGTRIQVEVYYTDDYGWEESVTSESTEPVVNVNDHPTLTSGTAGESGTVEEGAPIGTVVYVGTATDPDAGDVLTFSLGGQDAAAFQIDPASGAIRLLAPADYETQSIYLIDVRVTDAGGLFETQTVTILVSDVDESVTNHAPTVENPPADQSATAGAIFEFTLPQETFGDPDVGDNLTYTATLANGQPLPVWLTFDPETRQFSGTPERGDVTGEAPGRVEGQDLIHGLGGDVGFGENMWDGSDDIAREVDISSVFPQGLNFYGARHSSIWINDNGTVNLNRTFSTANPFGNMAYYNTYTTNKLFALFFADIDMRPASTDASEGGNSTGSNAAYWDLDTVHGVVSVTWDDVTEYYGTQGEPQNAFQMRFYNMGHGDFAVEYRYEEVNWDHNNTVAGWSSGNSSDYYDVEEHGYNMLTIDDQPNSLWFNFKNGLFVGLGGGLDIRVTATDQYGGSVSTTFTLSVQERHGTNHAPIMISGATGNVDENEPETTVVYTASASDVDVGDYLIFSLRGEDAGAFWIDASTGEVRLLVPADYESKPSYAIEVIVTDSEGLTDTQAVSITVTDVNETPANQAPTVTSPVSGSVAENDPETTVVYTASASDPDVGDSLTFTLGGTDAGAFSIDESTGEVRLLASADYESKPSYAIDVIVTDSGGLTDTQAVSIAVTDVNETPANQAPTITSPVSGSVVENDPETTVVYTASASDPDVGDSLTFSLGGEDAGAFSIDESTGEVRLLASADYETKPSYAIDVIVTDSGGLTDTQAVSITVTDVNETPANQAPTVTSPVSGSVAENDPETTVVYTASASDPDVGDSLTFTLGGTDAGAFLIDESTGEVRLLAPADYETKPSYAIEVIVTDGGGLTDTQAVSITVTDVNETPGNQAPTVTSPVSGSVAENDPVTTVVYTASASDPNVGDSLTFSLGGDDAGAFSIDESTGEVRLLASADYETKPSYAIEVIVTDGGGLTDTQAVSITVTDVNETPANQAPTIISSVSGSVAENAPIATVVYDASATDPNAGDPLTFTLGGPDAGAFSIDESTGEVRLLASADYETKP